MNRGSCLTIEEVHQQISFDQPLLSAEDGNDLITVSGTFLVRPASQEDWAGAFDRFEISVVIPKNYPRYEPLVFETADRIPRIVDRHCYTDGACCTGIFEEWIAANPYRTIGEFFDGPVRNFFLSQIYFEKYGTWPFGERAHGNAGVIEACMDILGLPKNEAQIKRYLFVLSGPWPKGHWLCPCGSGKKIRHCHKDQLFSMREHLQANLAKRLLKRLAPQKTLKNRNTRSDQIL